MLARLRTVFWDERHQRARVPWLIAVPLFGAFAVTVVAAEAVDGVLPLPAQALVVSGATAVAAVALVLVSRRFLGARRGLIGYGLAVDRRWVVDLLVGLGIGVVAVSIPYLIGIGAGWVTVVAVFDRGVLALWPGILLYSLAMLCTGLWEELVLRGVFVSNAADGLRRWLSPKRAIVGGVVVSSVVFGLGHFSQFDNPVFASTWILSGLVLGTIYVLSGNLALVIGAHATVNITANVLYVRTDVAGLGDMSAIMRIAVDPGVALLRSGGALDFAAHLAVGLLALAWLWYSRGALSMQVDALQLEGGPELEEDAEDPTPAPV